jgi:hypothetical protein
MFAVLQHAGASLALISEQLMPPLSFFLIGGVLSGVLIFSGGLWAYDPKLFVLVHRRITIGDFYVRTTEWEQKMVGLEGRLCRFLFCGAGLGLLYLLFKTARLL